MPIHWLTVLLLGIVGLTTYRAYRAGFVRELVSLAALILAIPIAGLFVDDLYPKVQPLVGGVIIAGLVSFLALLAGVIIGGQILSHLLRRSAALLNLGGVDQIAGATFGLAKGLLVCQVLLIALVVFPRPDMRTHIDESSVARAMVDGSTVVLNLLPGGFGEGVSHFLEGRYPEEEAPPGPLSASQRPSATP